MRDRPYKSILKEDSNEITAKKDAVTTYIEQTKLLVTLSSAFVLVPSVLLTSIKDTPAIQVEPNDLKWFLASQIFFILSVLSGYVVLATISGTLSGKINPYNIFRTATRVSSLFQIGFYLSGMIIFTYQTYIAMK